MRERPAPLVVRVYAALARLLPPDMEGDRQEVAATFAELWRERRGAVGRLRLAAVSFPALAWVALVEWLEFVGVRPAPGRAAHGPGWGRGGMGFTRNLRFALRTLRKAPAFTFTSVLLVGVGVGAVTTIFTLVDHVLLRPLPYPAADRLVALEEGSFPGPLFREFEKLAGVEEWAGGWETQVNLVGAGEPIHLAEARVTEDFMHLFGARAQRGRLLDPDDFANPDVVVLSGEAWRRVWGADPGVVGGAIQVDGRPVTVVGIMDDAFVPPEALLGSRIDLYRPLDWSMPELSTHEYFVLQVAGRRSDDVALSGVQAEIDALMTRMAGVHRNYTRRDGTPRTIPVLTLADMTVQDVRLGLGLLLGAVGLLLLVACANVAHLFLARGLGRGREMAVRRALGAGTSTLTAQLLVESLVVGLAGGLLGVGVAILGIRAFVLLSPEALPRQASVAVDPRVLLFAVGISALTSLVFGLLPALRSMRGELADELRAAGRTATSGRGPRMVRNGLVVAEVALSLVLVAGAGLMLRSFLAVRAQEPGFDIAGVWTVPLRIPDPESPEAYRELMDEVLRQVEGVPGVRSATYGLTAPMDRTGGSHCCWGTTPKVPGRADEDPDLQAYVHPVTPAYFATLGIRVVAGRSWSLSEGAAEPTPVMVNETYARELAGSVQGAVGMGFGLRDRPATVVGVVADNRHYGLDQPMDNALYVPMDVIPFAIGVGTVVARVDEAAEGSMPRALRAAVWAAAPGLPVPTVRSMREAVDRSTALRRFEWSLFAAFGGVALLLAAGGLYGTLLYVAGQRKREMGIRLALGASRARVEAEVLRVGVALGVTGVVLGLGGAWMANRLLESLVWGVERGDPVSLGGAAAVLLLTAVVASWLPARRAGRVDPLETLRME